MTFIIEVSGPFQARPGHFRSDSMSRWVWLWFAVAVLHVPLREFAETPYHWQKEAT